MSRRALPPLYYRIGVSDEPLPAHGGHPGRQRRRRLRRETGQRARERQLLRERESERGLGPASENEWQNVMKTLHECLFRLFKVKRATGHRSSVPEKTH